MSEPCRIQFCNLNPRSNAERDWLIAAGCEQRDCLGRCSLCFETRFVVVDALTVEGEAYEAIVAEAKKDCGEAGAAGSADEPRP